MAALDPVYETLFRYLHVLSGITWIGLLYFFNLANLPLLKFPMKKPFDVDASEKAGASLAAKTLFWFRWGAAGTLLFGLLLLWAETKEFTDAGLSAMDYFLNNGPAGYLIGMGVLFALVMFFNVWFIIWPHQQVVLANNKRIAAGAPEEEKKKLQAENAPRVKAATFASRTNTWLSVPMLFGMVFGAHGGFGDLSAGLPAFIVLGLILLAMVVYSKRK